jgi:hypothetical protein
LDLHQDAPIGLAGKKTMMNDETGKGKGKPARGGCISVPNSLFSVHHSSFLLTLFATGPPYGIANCSPNRALWADNGGFLIILATSGLAWGIMFGGNIRQDRLTQSV